MNFILRSSLILTFCSSSWGTFASPEKELVKLNVCLPQYRHEFLSLVTLEAIDQGFFAKQGLKVDVTYSSRGGKRLQRWKKGGVSAAGGLDRDVATHVGYSPQVCAFGSSNIDRYIADPDATKVTAPVMVSMYGEEYDTNLVVAKDSKIKSIKDLKGKKIRVGQLPTLMGVIGALEEDGLSLDDVDLASDVDAFEKVVALKDGQVAALTTYMPLMSYMMATGDFRVLKSNIVKNYVAARVPHSLLIVNKRFATKNPEVVEKYKKAMNEAYDFILRNPSEIIHIVERHSQKMNGESWKVPDVIAVKAGAFMGKVIMKDITTASEASQRVEIHCQIQNYNKIAIKNGYASKVADLSAWLGIAEDQKKCVDKVARK